MEDPLSANEESQQASNVQLDVDFEKSHGDHPFIWWAALLGPFVVTAAVLGLVYLNQGWEVMASYLGAAATAFFGAGRFIILLGSDEPNPDARFFLKYLDARNLFVMLTWMDVMVAIFVAFHMAVLFKLPWIGQRMESLVDDGEFILKRQPWIRRIAFWGLVGFVIFPTSTTGSIGGSIFGRLMGMSRFTIVFAIMIGSILGNGIMLVFAKQVNKVMPEQDSLWMKIAGVVLMIVILFFFERYIKGLKQSYVDMESAQAESSDPDVSS